MSVPELIHQVTPAQMQPSHGLRVPSQRRPPETLLTPRKVPEVTPAPPANKNQGVPVVYRPTTGNYQAPLKREMT